MRRQNSSGSGENFFHATNSEKKLDNGLILSKFIVARNLFDLSFFHPRLQGITQAKPVCCTHDYNYLSGDKCWQNSALQEYVSLFGSWQLANSTELPSTELALNWLTSFSRKLVDRLEGMRQCRLGNGETECILCGETFRFYHRSQRRCAECKKMTCAKCGSESVVKTSGTTWKIRHLWLSRLG